MILPLLADIVRWLIAGFFVAAVAVVALRATGEGIVMREFFTQRRGGGIEINRLQSFVMSSLFAAGYAIAALARDPAHGMPHIPGALLLILSGSQTSYLWSKFAARNAG